MIRPSSLHGAVGIIRATFPAEELQAWAAQPEGSAGGQAHFELGMWIRNNWVHGSGSPLATQIEKFAGVIDADQISAAIVKALWRVLNGLPCSEIEELVKPSQSRITLEWD
ncbi:MAG: hypothetical protein A2063_03560 [Gallionellales bacterium GWA2_60_142]|nr:MAG: hypothetical protein A2063_03560 [Gallionellales bacterium GWA2_60_142]HCI14014.1 hypothetical protein [Gallionellaceae bacterium]